MTFRDLSPLFVRSDRHLVVVPWLDARVDTHGHPVESDYVEWFWTGTLGPTAVLVLRRLAGAASVHDKGFRVDLVELGSALGLVWTAGRPCPLRRSIERLVMFGAAAVRSERLAIRRSLPPLGSRQIERLPEHLRIAHADWITDSRAARLPWPGRADRAEDTA